MVQATRPLGILMRDKLLRALGPPGRMVELLMPDLRL